MELSIASNLFYFLAAMFALGAASQWFRFVDNRVKDARRDNVTSLRGLDSAATGTGLALGCAAIGFLISLF